MADDTRTADAFPDEYARAWGLAQGTLTVRPSTIRTGQVLGVGGTTLYVVQTFRRIERNEQGKVTHTDDTVFVEIHGRESSRFVLPPAVAEAIARQRDALTGKFRRITAKRTAEARKAAGIVPFARKTKPRA